MPLSHRSLLRPSIHRLTLLAGTTLLVALGAMVAVHVLQPEFDLTHQPLSYLVHGTGGWLLNVALAAFGGALLALARAVRPWPEVRAQRVAKGSLRWSGIGLIAAAVFPSDGWFPWEQAPSVSGLIHAFAGVVAPGILAIAVTALRRRSRALLVTGGSYAALILVCGVSLLVGWVTDRAPPGIGAAERLLGASGFFWSVALLQHLTRVGAAVEPPAIPEGVGGSLTRTRMPRV